MEQYIIHDISYSSCKLLIGRVSRTELDHVAGVDWGVDGKYFTLHRLHGLEEIW